ncbi:MAG: transglutaminase family protein [Acidimicrobiales bacterium]
MTWRLRINHRTGHRYENEVVSSYNEARLMPLSTPEQLAIEAEVVIEPAVRSFRYWDYWGTLVHAFDIHDPHTELVVTGTSVVETAAPRPIPDDMGWAALTDPAVRDRFTELLAPTDYVPLDDQIAGAAAALADGNTPAGTCRAVGEWVRDRLRYQTGSTTVSTTALDALHQGTGVCQDFAHLSLALLRAAGLPCRYVSGYLHPTEGEEVGTTVAGQSHAWIEAWLGDWYPFDPTNGRDVGERHVVVGRARDYADVAPLKGIFHGGPACALEVTVELTRLA